MPLVPGNSRRVISNSISEMAASGHPQAQAVAASLSNARRHPHAAFGGRFASGGNVSIDVTPPSIVAANSSIPALTGAQISAYPTMPPAASIPPVGGTPSPYSNAIAQVPMSALSGGAGSNGIIAPVNNQGIPQGSPGAPISTPNSAFNPPGAAKGGKIKQKMAEGGIPTSEAMDPWYTRAEYRGMIHPEGLITSTGAGRTDVHNINVPTGSYIVPADVVSGLSEGNTLGGASVIDRMMHSNPYGIQGGARRGSMGPPRMPTPAMFKEPPNNFNLESRGGKAGDHFDGAVPIVVAGGEFLIHPHTIAQKFGSLKKGHAVLDAFVKEVRAKNVKETSKLPGPKK